LATNQKTLQFSRHGRRASKNHNKGTILSSKFFLFSLSVQVFRKYSNSLGPDTLELLEAILDSHEIEDADVESSIETIAREYNKQDGA
jgi:hypothetical protein